MTTMLLIIIFIDVVLILVSIRSIIKNKIIPEENREFYKKYKKNGRRQKLIGEDGYVTREIDNFKDKGEIKIGHRSYKARSCSGAWIEEGSDVKVTGVALNNYLIVKDLR